MSNAMMSVSSLNIKIKSLLEATFMHIWVEGEVASVTYHTSGHLYFSIKDQESSIKCVMWRSSVGRLKFQLERGMRIVIEGSIGVYTPRGEYQFFAVHIEPYGQGALALAYQQLKERLQAKGYFDALHKKTLPKYIQKIALVTAKESAGLHDMLKIIEKRWAMVEVFIVDTLVQGENAPAQISHALRYADGLGVDVVVVGRGGGSSEDLWAFNTEAVADAIFAMQTPVVSAVGHEVDVLLSDFVADLRAPTPSASIEMILPDSQEIRYRVEEIRQRLGTVIAQKIVHFERELKHTYEILLGSSPSRELQDKHRAFERLAEEFARTIQHKIAQKSHDAKAIEQKIQMSDPKLQCRKGWAKISIEGRVVDLSEIKPNQKFMLEDEENRIEAYAII